MNNKKIDEITHTFLQEMDRISKENQGKENDPTTGMATIFIIRGYIQRAYEAGQTDMKKEYNDLLTGKN